MLAAVIGAYWLIKRQEGMGFGDVKLLAMIGAFLGPQGVVLTLFVGALASVVVALILAATGRLTPAAPPAGAGLPASLRSEYR